MANVAKGEASVVAGGATYTLAFNMNAICEVEDGLDAPMSELDARLASPRASDMRFILWAMLQQHHGDQFPDVASVGEAFGFVEATDAMRAGVSAAFPTAADGDGGAAGKPRPRRGATSK